MTSDGIPLSPVSGTSFAKTIPIMKPMHIKLKLRLSEYSQQMLPWAYKIPLDTETNRIILEQGPISIYIIKGIISEMRMHTKCHTSQGVKCCLKKEGILAASTSCSCSSSLQDLELAVYFLTKATSEGAGTQTPIAPYPFILHVWNIYLHLAYI